MRFQDAQPNLEDMLSRFWPIGSVYISVDSTNPAVTLGIGTWAAFGAGRCLVGVDSSDADFDAAEKTSGSKTVTLTEAQLPAHTHTVTDPGHTHVENSNNTTTGSLRGWGAPDTSTNQSTATGFSTASSQTGVTIGNTGGGQAHPNVQPSIAVFMWKRTG